MSKPRSALPVLRASPLLLVTLVLPILFGPVSADAQPASTIARVGILGLGVAPPLPSPLGAALREFGWIDGQNLIIERRYTQSPEQLPQLAAELVALRVSVIVTAGTPAAWAAKNATTTVPIVMAVVNDPVRSGLVSSLARPDGNATGVALPGSAKALELLKEAVPTLSRVAILRNPANSAHSNMADDIDASAQILKVKPPQRIDVQTGADLDGAFAAILRHRAQAFILLPPTLAIDVQRFAEFALRNRLPSLSLSAFSKQYVPAGGLMYYGPDYSEHQRRTAALVDKILRGAKPSALPFEQPTKYEFIINLKTAKALDLTLPQSLLLRARGFIE